MNSDEYLKFFIEDISKLRKYFVNRSKIPKSVYFSLSDYRFLEQLMKLRNEMFCLLNASDRDGPSVILDIKMTRKIP